MNKELEKYFDRLWPICRSLAGPGFRESLDILSELMPVERLRFATGKKVHDWTVPREWEIKDAYLIGPDGKKYADFKENNLHILNYSVPFRGKMDLEELRPHLYSLPELPDAIPYLTSYYKERWGFCLAHRVLQSLPRGQYEAFIDARHYDGNLEIGEAVLPGQSTEEILFSSYLCHPSMANNELSGPLVTAFLYKKIAEMPRRRYTYRFAIMPETIGAIAYLSLRGAALKRKLAAGYQVTCVGNPGPWTYKRSRKGASLSDRAAETVLRDSGAEYETLTFDPSTGSDERQYCSPGYDLPIGSLMRTMYGRYPQYHTSLDNKNFISFETLAKSVEMYYEIVQTLESNHVWKNKVMFGEPQLGRRGLYPTLGAQKEIQNDTKAMLWFLNLADGTRDVIGIAQASGQPAKKIIEIADRLAKSRVIAKKAAK